jgi:zinc transporter
VLSETGLTSRSDVLMLRKDLIMLRRHIAPQREALARLTTETPTWLDEMSRVRLRDITDRLVRYIEVIDQVTSRASLVQDEIAGQISDSMNRRTYIFTVVAAIFLPLGFITGLLGVNVGGVPGVDDPRAFLQLVIACTLIGMGLIAAFRWRRWM